MQLATYGIVVASTVTHAYWNFLIKRSGGGQLFVGLSKVLEAVVFAPFFVAAVLVGNGMGWASAWALVIVGAALTLTNYLALGRAYERGDMSIVYPVARGGTLLFLPALGFLAFGERLSALGWVALASILAGIIVLQLPALERRAAAALAPSLASASVAYALIAALAAAGYAVWDKRAVQTLPPFLYFYAYSALVAAAYGAFLVRRYPSAALRAEWRAHRWPILQVAVLNTVTYVMVLFALRTASSTYVVAVRQMSIAVGAVLAWRLLGETFSAPRRLGVALVVAGCVLVALVR
jgi:drug/metabolite transporter (DMT)-like permease